jgi:cytochrome c-type biogenesis protein CcmH/NrfG
LRKAEAYESLARSTAAGGPAKSAIKASARVTQLDPTNVRAWLGQARLLDASADHSRRSLRAYAKVTELDPKNDDAWRRRIAILDELGETPEAADVRAKVAAREI